MQEINVQSVAKDFNDTSKFRAEVHSLLQEPALQATRDLTALSKALVQAGKLQDLQVLVDQDAQGRIVTKTPDGHYHVWKDGPQSQDEAATKAYDEVHNWGSNQRKFHPSADQSLVYFFDKTKHDNLSAVLYDYLHHNLGRNPNYAELNQEVKRVAAANQIKEADYTRLPDGFRLVIPPDKAESHLPVVSLLPKAPVEHEKVTLKSKAPARIELTQPIEMKSLTNITERPSASGKTFELYKLDHRSGEHHAPDAIVHVSANFDPKKPINLVIYNHGYGSTAKTAYAESDLERQLASAPPNTVLVVPEWQESPGSRSGDEGRLGNPNMYRGMLQEVFDKTPGLKGKTLADVDNISLIAHSAGYQPSETALYNNGLFDKVKSITLLDALYDDQGFDPWLQANLKDLHSGKKHFYNFFSATVARSTAQEQRMEKMFKRAGLAPGHVLKDYNHGTEPLDDQSLSTYPVVFKFSQRVKDGLGPHASMPGLYIAPILRASNANPNHTSDLVAQAPKPPEVRDAAESDASRLQTQKEKEEREVQKQLTAAASWHMSQKGDDPNPACWFGCSATSLHMALLRNGVTGFQQNESHRLKLISDLHVSRVDGFHGGVDGMASYARKYGLKTEVHHSRGAENELNDLESVVRPGSGGAIVNGGLRRADGSTLKHYIYVSSMIGDKYVVGDPQQEKPVLWTRQQMLAFLQRDSYGFVAVSKPENNARSFA